MIDPLTLQLFGQFPREVANPARAVAHSERDFENFLTFNEGIRDCYTSVFPLTDTIDKIYQDFDMSPGLCTGEQALEDSQRVYQYLVEEKGHIVVPVASGKKGINLHTLLTPMSYVQQQDVKSKLYRVTIKVLYDVFGEVEQGTEIDSTGKRTHVYYAVEEKYRILGADPQVVGDVRRICRIPNTRRPPNNYSWCTFLPPEFVKSSWLDIVNWTKMPHRFDRVPNSSQSLNDMSEISEDKTPNLRISDSVAELVQFPIPIEVNGFLREVLRPCLYQRICQPNPQHPVRAATSVDLLRCWSPQEITEIFSTLGWTDWDPNITYNQITSCQNLKEYGCKKLRQLGVCIVEYVEDCPLRTVQVVVDG